MKTVIKNTNIALMYALLTTIGLGLYFMLMRVLGLAEHTTLRALNIVILFIGIYKSISTFKSVSGTDFSYFKGLITGFKTALFTALFFIGSILLYYTFDPIFIDNLLLEGRIAGTGSIFGATGMIMIEAIGSGLITSFMCMQYLKTPRHVLPQHTH